MQISTALEHIKNGIMNLENIPKNLSDDKNFVLEVMKVNPNYLKIIGSHIDEKREMIKSILSEDKGYWSFAGREIKKDKDMVLFYINKYKNDLNSFIVNTISSSLYNDKDVMQVCTSLCSVNIEKANKQLLDNYEFMETVIKRDCFTYLYASEELQSDKKLFNLAFYENNVKDYGDIREKILESIPKAILKNLDLLVALFDCLNEAKGIKYYLYKLDIHEQHNLLESLLENDVIKEVGIEKYDKNEFPKRYIVKEDVFQMIFDMYIYIKERNIQESMKSNIVSPKKALKF